MARDTEINVDVTVEGESALLRADRALNDVEQSAQDAGKAIDTTQRGFATIGQEASQAGRSFTNFGTVVKPFTLSPSIHEVALAAAYASEDDRAIRNLGYMASELLKFVAAKELDPLVTEEIPAADIVKGLQRLSERHVRGKIIATFN